MREPRRDCTVVVDRGAATPLSGFVTTRNRPVTQATMVSVTWLATGLQVRVGCVDTAVVAQVRERNDPDIWRDDSVEVFLDPGHRHSLESRWYHVIVNARGSIWEERGPVSRYFSSGDPQGGVAGEDLPGLVAEAMPDTNGWRATLFIPWQGLGATPAEGEVWGFNVARSDYPLGEYTCFSPTWGVFLNPDQWGHLVFGAGAAGATTSASNDIEARHGEVLRARALDREQRACRAPLPAAGQTWVEIDGVCYGARPDQRGPAGGGAGYKAVVTNGTWYVSTLDELLGALAKAHTGDVVFVDGGAVLDCTTPVQVDGLKLVVPGGVTLASDRGHAGSPGALLCSDVFGTRPLIECGGPGVRITGLRLRGPDPDPRRDLHTLASRRGAAQGVPDGFDSAAYYRFPNSEGIRTEHSSLEVDNCELAGWSHAAIYMLAGGGHRIHHNYIHHNQRIGLGYGVEHDKAESLIEQNLFNHNRHSIAGTGAPSSGYEARDNVELGAAVGHCFDMHGGADRKDGTSIAGTWLTIRQNTFQTYAMPVNIRGIPERGGEVRRNWFLYDQKVGLFRSSNGVPSNVVVRDNAFGTTRPIVTGRTPVK